MQGEAQGFLQVLGERRLIERASLDKYTMDGQKDTISGNVDLQDSLCSLLGKCKDFKEEATALQCLGTQLGVTILLTPKFHAELAGEGVEYSWAHLKAYYRRMPLSRKRGRNNFKQLVKDCTCPVNVLTKQKIEKFASRARAYICSSTHHHLNQEQKKQAAEAGADQNSVSNTRSTIPVAGIPPPKQELLYSEIEWLMKAFKGHRCALDFDRGFVNSEFMDAIVKMDCRPIWRNFTLGFCINQVKCTRLYARRVERETCYTLERPCHLVCIYIPPCLLLSCSSGE